MAVSFYYGGRPLRMLLCGACERRAAGDETFRVWIETALGFAVTLKELERIAEGTPYERRLPPHTGLFVAWAPIYGTGVLAERIIR